MRFFDKFKKKKTEPINDDRSRAVSNEVQQDTERRELVVYLALYPANVRVSDTVCFYRYRDHIDFTVVCVRGSNVTKASEQLPESLIENGRVYISKLLQYIKDRDMGLSASAPADNYVDIEKFELVYGHNPRGTLFERMEKDSAKDDGTWKEKAIAVLRQYAIAEFRRKRSWGAALSLDRIKWPNTDEHTILHKDKRGQAKLVVKEFPEELTLELYKGEQCIARLEKNDYFAIPIRKRFKMAKKYDFYQFAKCMETEEDYNIFFDEELNEAAFEFYTLWQETRDEEKREKSDWYPVAIPDELQGLEPNMDITNMFIYLGQRYSSQIITVKQESGRYDIIISGRDGQCRKLSKLQAVWLEQQVNKALDSKDDTPWSSVAGNDSLHVTIEKNNETCVKEHFFPPLQKYMDLEHAIYSLTKYGSVTEGEEK